MRRTSSQPTALPLPPREQERPSTSPLNPRGRDSSRSINQPLSSTLPANTNIRKFSTSESTSSSFKHAHADGGMSPGLGRRGGDAFRNSYAEKLDPRVKNKAHAPKPLSMMPPRAERSLSRPVSAMASFGLENSLERHDGNNNVHHLGASQLSNGLHRMDGYDALPPRPWSAAAFVPVSASPSFLSVGRQQSVAPSQQSAESLGSTMHGDRSLSTLSFASERRRVRANEGRSTTVISAWTPGAMSWHADIRSKGLTEIPKWVLARTNLRILHLSHNQIFFLPPDIQDLAALQDLRLDSNKLAVLPRELWSFEYLQCLDLSSNLLSEISPDVAQLGQLRRLIISNNKLAVLPPSLCSGSFPHLQVLDASMNQIAELPHRLDHLISLERLIVGFNKIKVIPSQIRHLKHIQELDFRNNRLEDLDEQQLVLLAQGEGGVRTLTSLDLSGNSRLLWPPPEISSQGGKAVAEYLRVAAAQGGTLPNHELVLVMIGEKGSGKTSLIHALMSPDGHAANMQDDEKRKDRKVGAVASFVPWQADGDLTLQILDVAGHAVYSVTHQLFLMRRAVYLFVWRVRRSIDGTLPEWQVVELESMVHEWIDSLQHKVPGASLLFVCTHIDVCTEEDEIASQCAVVSKAACTRIEYHSQVLEGLHEDDGENMPTCTIVNEGESMRVNVMNGEGVKELADAVVKLTKNTHWYGEQLPSSLMRLRDELMELERSGKAWCLSFGEFVRLADRCNVNRHEHLKMATMFLHDMGVLRYFGDVDQAREALEQGRVNTLIEDTVYISLPWIVEACKYLRSDGLHACLMDFFSTDSRHKDKQMAFRVRRLMTHGVIHPSLVPFIWPEVSSWPGLDGAVIESFWDAARAAGHATRTLVGNVSEEKSHHEGVRALERVLLLLEGLDMAALGRGEAGKYASPASRPSTAESCSSSISSENNFRLDLANTTIVVPGMLSTGHRFRVDSRVFGNDCLFRCSVTYAALPPGFFGRLIVRLRRHASHMDFNSHSAAFYRMGTKLQVFVNSFRQGQPSSTVLTALFSSKQLWEPFKQDLATVEKFFPGLKKVSFEGKVARNDATGRRKVLLETRRKIRGVLPTPHTQSNAFSHLLGLMSDGVRAQSVQEQISSLETSLNRVSDQVQCVILHTQSAYDFAASLHKALQELGQRLEGQISVALRGPEDIRAGQDVSLARVILVCVDLEFSQDPLCLEDFKARVAAHQSIIPLILPGYIISDFARWWPDSMPEMMRFSLFLDMRGEEWREVNWKIGMKEYYSQRQHLVKQLRALATAGDGWAQYELQLATGFSQMKDSEKRSITVRTLHQDIARVLEEWRGEAADASSRRSVRVPCVTCVKERIVPPGGFDRSQCVTAQEEWREGTLRNFGKRMTPPPPPVLTCSHGHPQDVRVILSSSAIHDSIACPSCLEHPENHPPWCFSRSELLSFFDEANEQRLGAMTCPKCAKLELPPLRILDIIAPEVFLSYQWGHRTQLFDGTSRYSTQEMVKKFRSLIEVQADVLCWLDVGGGLASGQQLLLQIEQGMERAFVAVLFMSDAYCNSDNCLREFTWAVHGGKYLIPVLVPPPDDAPHTGWTGHGHGDVFWWKHARDCCKGEGAVEADSVPWEALQEFTPIDLRHARDEAEHEIVRRVLARFHREGPQDRQMSRGRKVWRKLRMIHKFGGRGSVSATCPLPIQAPATPSPKVV